MRRIHWVMTILAANILHLFLFLQMNPETRPVLTWVAIGIHVAACFGPFWMLYDWFIRRKKGELKAWMWLFPVPWGFLWYYFEQYRPSRMPEKKPV